MAASETWLVTLDVLMGEGPPSVSTHFLWCPLGRQVASAGVSEPREGPVCSCTFCPFLCHCHHTLAAWPLCTRAPEVPGPEPHDAFLLWIGNCGENGASPGSQISWGSEHERDDWGWVSVAPQPPSPCSAGHKNSVFS